MIVVSGYRRSGTSMMMHSLFTGLEGGQLVFQPSLERLNPDSDGYQPNPNGLYEVGQAYYMNALFLRKMPEDSVVKILFDGLASLPKGEYKIIFMFRDESEIIASLQKSDAHITAHGVKPNIDFPGAFNCFRPYKQDDIDHVLGICEARSDFELIKVNFRDVIEDPIEAFTNIKFRPSGKVRIPLDIEKAASVVDPKLYRSKIDDDDQDRGAGVCAESSSNEQTAA